MDLRSLGLLLAAIFVGVVVGFWVGYSTGVPDSDQTLSELNQRSGELARRSTVTARNADEQIALNIELRKQLAYTEAMLAPYEKPDGTIEQDPWEVLKMRMEDARVPLDERHRVVHEMERWLRDRNEAGLASRSPNELFIGSDTPTAAGTDRAAALHAALRRILEQD